MTRSVDQYPDLPNTEDYTKALMELLRESTGYPKTSTYARGIFDAVRVLRSRPELAARLLEICDGGEDKNEENKIN